MIVKKTSGTGQFTTGQIGQQLQWPSEGTQPSESRTASAPFMWALSSSSSLVSPASDSTNKPRSTSGLLGRQSPMMTSIHRIKQDEGEAVHYPIKKWEELKKKKMPKVEEEKKRCKKTTIKTKEATSDCNQT